MLNYAFGTQFYTSVGRCTSGLFFTIQKLDNQINGFEYIVIVDTEGLLSADKHKLQSDELENDDSFDKKISLFILSISHIVLINVKGEIHDNFKKIIQIVLFSLVNLHLEYKPKLKFIFNQNHDINDKLV